MRGREGPLLYIRYFLDTYGSLIWIESGSTRTDVNEKANIVKRDPREERRINMQRVKTGDLAYPNKAARSFLERSMTMKILLKVVGVFGVSLVMSGRPLITSIFEPPPTKTH